MTISNSLPSGSNDDRNRDPDPDLTSEFENRQLPANPFDDDHKLEYNPKASADFELNLTGNSTDSETPLPQTAPSFGVRLNDRYTLGEEVGRGGVAVVYSGRDHLLDRQVAIKVLHDKYRDNVRIRTRFVREAKITARLNHHGIIPVQDLGTCPDGLPFYVMRFILGETLDKLLARRKSLVDDLSELVPIFLRICQAVAFAHSNGVIHRDLKPANIIIGDFGTTKILDWGLAKVLGESDLSDILASVGIPESWQHDVLVDADNGETQQGTVFGTPSYLPPEQARGEISLVEKPADVFGLGCILCEILTGRPPYVGETTSRILAKARQADLGEAITLLEGCLAPLDLVSLAMWCLDPIPSNRPASAEDIVEVLHSYVRADQRRAEQDLIRFFELSLDLFCIAGTDGYFQRVNENFCSLLGYTMDQLKTVPFVEFVHPEDREQTIHETIKLAQGYATTKQFLNRYRCANGEYRWLEWNAQAVSEERAIYAVARDVTNRQAELAALRHAEDRMNAFADSANRLKDQTRSAKFLGSCAGIFTQARGLQESLQAVAELAVAHLQVDLAQVWILANGSDVLELKAMAGLFMPHEGEFSHISLGVGMLGKIALTRQALLTNSRLDHQQPDLAQPELNLPAELTSFAGYPLVYGDQTVGVLAVGYRQVISQQLFQTLSAISCGLALVIRVNQIEQQH